MLSNRFARTIDHEDLLPLEITKSQGEMAKTLLIWITVGMDIAFPEVKIKECESMIPLTQRTAGGAMSPLKYS